MHAAFYWAEGQHRLKTKQTTCSPFCTLFSLGILFLHHLLDSWPPPPKANIYFASCAADLMLALVPVFFFFFLVNPWISSHCYVIVYCSGCPTYARPEEELNICPPPSRQWGRGWAAALMSSHSSEGDVGEDFTSSNCICAMWCLKSSYHKDLLSIIILCGGRAAL